METSAVALAGEEDRGWLVEAASGEEAIDIVRGELLAWTERYYRAIRRGYRINHDV